MATRWAVSAVLVALALGGCSGASLQDNLEDEEVMAAFRQAARISGTELSDKELDDVARRLCEGWADGENDAELATRVAQDAGIPVGLMSGIANAANRTVCPDTDRRR
jgi:hypothetical protein